MHDKILITLFVLINIFSYFTPAAFSQSVSDSSADVVSESREINPISYGILNSSKKPIAYDIWKDTHQEDILTLLSILPSSNFQSLHLLI